jgi:hypothetical protein
VTLIKVPVYTKRPSRLCERRSEAGPRFVCESDHCAGRQIWAPGSLAEELYSVADPETFSSLSLALNFSLCLLSQTVLSRRAKVRIMVIVCPKEEVFPLCHR